MQGKSYPLGYSQEVSVGSLGSDKLVLPLFRSSQVPLHHPKVFKVCNLCACFYYFIPHLALNGLIGMLFIIDHFP